MISVTYIKTKKWRKTLKIASYNNKWRRTIWVSHKTQLSWTWLISEFSAGIFISLQFKYSEWKSKSILDKKNCNLASKTFIAFIVFGGGQWRILHSLRSKQPETTLFWRWETGNVNVSQRSTVWCERTIFLLKVFICYSFIVRWHCAYTEDAYLNNDYPFGLSFSWDALFFATWLILFFYKDFTQLQT